MQKLKSFFSNPWAITIISSTIGVYMGIFSNNYFETRSEKRDARELYSAIQEEMTFNCEALMEWDSVANHAYAFFNDFFPYIDEEEDGLKMTVEQMQQIQQKYPDDFLIEDSTLLRKDTFLYAMEVTLQLNSRLLLLPHKDQAWNSLRENAYSKYIDFTCKSTLDEFYSFHDLSNRYRSNWVNMLLESLFQADDDFERRLMRNLEFEIAINSLLLEFCSKRGEWQECIK